MVSALFMGLAVGACGGGASPSPVASPAAVATVAPAPTPVPTTTPTPVPTTTPPAPTASVTPAASAACVTLPQTGLLPSDRMTDVKVARLSGRDVVRFVFGEGSLTPAGAPTGTLDVARPPFTQASSGSRIDLLGEHALKVVFTAMSLQNDAMEPTYDGQREFKVGGASPILRHVVLFDESEGQIGWYAGYDGSGCVTLTRDGNDVVLTFAPG